jgi:hypothetical protein
MKHCFKNNLKIYFTHFASITPDAPGSTERALALTSKDFPNKVRGVDYVNLGYATGASASVILFCENIRKVYQYDYFNTPIDQIPMMSEVKDISDFQIVYIMTGPWGSGLYSVFRDFLQPRNIPLISICLTMDVPMIMPYRTAGLTNAIIGGSTGNGQYEFIIGYYGRGIAMMDIQNIIQIFMLIAALSANIPIIRERLKGEKKS